MDRAIPAELRDDRFASDVGADNGFRRAVTWGDETGPAGFVSLSGTEADPQLDLLVARPAMGPDEPAADDELVGQATRAVRELASEEAITMWGRPANPIHEAVAAGLGLAPHRGLHRMGMDLNEPPATALSSRPYSPADHHQLLEVNNAAFGAHPDQGGWTASDLDARLSEPWVRNDGIRLYEQDGQLAGFCWVKIHDYLDPVLGEIFVIGLHPNVWGQGLGAPMTAAGLDWMYQQGVRRVMLYVEDDNAPAIATYQRLGMTIWATDRAWKGAVGTIP